MILSSYVAVLKIKYKITLTFLKLLIHVSFLIMNSLSKNQFCHSIAFFYGYI